MKAISNTENKSLKEIERAICTELNFVEKRETRPLEVRVATKDTIAKKEELSNWSRFIGFIRDLFFCIFFCCRKKKEDPAAYLKLFIGILEAKDVPGHDQAIRDAFDFLQPSDRKKILEGIARLCQGSPEALSPLAFFQAHPRDEKVLRAAKEVNADSDLTKPS
jgi:hypothetical protein